MWRASCGIVLDGDVNRVHELQGRTDGTQSASGSSPTSSQPPSRGRRQHQTRRAFAGERLAIGPEFFPLVIGLFTDPETIPTSWSITAGWSGSVLPDGRSNRDPGASAELIRPLRAAVSREPKRRKRSGAPNQASTAAQAERTGRR
jgi:hypothetical protein